MFAMARTSNVERIAHAERACSVAAAAAHDVNDELTIILNGTAELLADVGLLHYAHPMLLDIHAAAARCARKTAGLLAHSARGGARPVNMPLEKLIESERGTL